MKIIHTSDWHLGHALYGYDRMEEQRAMLEQVTEVVRREQPDALLVSGDVYHTAQPSVAVQRLFAEAMMSMREACPRMTIVVTAGNHDSGARHEIFRVPWQALGINMIGSIDKDNPSKHIFVVSSASCVPYEPASPSDNIPAGIIVALPYAPERSIADGFITSLMEEVAQRNTANLPVVVMAHTTVAGCDFTGHERATELTVGGIDALPLDAFGIGYDYLALGHIHRPQMVGRQGSARYCGSPLPVSFDEAYTHSITIVEIGGHCATPDIRTEEIINPHPLVTLPAKGAASWEDCKQLLSEFPVDICAYIRLCVKVDDFLPPDSNAEAEALAKERNCRFCYINAVRPEQNNTESRIMTVQEFVEEAPMEIARRYATDLGIDFDEDMERMFAEAARQFND